MRVESGPVQFGDDWPGLFLRGDRAVPASILLKQLLEKAQRAGLFNAMEIAQLHSLVRDLAACDVSRDPSGKLVTKLKSFEDCKP